MGADRRLPGNTQGALIARQQSSMKTISYNFRNAEAILAQTPAWSELQAIIDGVTRDDVLIAQKMRRDSSSRTPTGAQTVVNQIMHERLVDADWDDEVMLFDTSAPESDRAKWAMDFRKSRIGVEVSFNHAEAIAWTLVRLNIAGESTEVKESSAIDAGVAIFPTKSFKSWGRMDGAVGVFERARDWLEIMRPVLPIPILLIGLDPDWEPVGTDIFRGPKGRPSVE
jgi:hypothetical protein